MNDKSNTVSLKAHLAHRTEKPQSETIASFSTAVPQAESEVNAGGVDR